ncbi:MAG TPA: SCP2 sterol-binding domain-containing protein [Geobacteraceae bacterium]|nr:SCP2 sterol-binding domain-containing protein [Geobacteraceae bacterium]
MQTYATLRRLTGRKKDDAEGVFFKAAELLQESPDKGTIQFSIITGNGNLEWCLRMHPAGCDARLERAPKPDLEIIVTSEAWRQIAEGKLSPLVAFARRKMRVRGNVALGKSVLRQLAKPGGKLDIC